MPTFAIHHVNFHVAQPLLEDMKNFYCDVMELTPGFRPELDIGCTQIQYPWFICMKQWATTYVKLVLIQYLIMLRFIAKT